MADATTTCILNHRNKLISLFTDAEDIKLISLVEENRPLYDPHILCYKDSTTRDTIWKNIAAALNKTDEDCRRRWKHIRDSFNRHKRVLKKCADPSFCKTNPTKSVIYEKLQFLNDCIVKRPVSTRSSSSKSSTTATVTSDSIQVTDESGNIILNNPNGNVQYIISSPTFSYLQPVSTEVQIVNDEPPSPKVPKLKPTILRKNQESPQSLKRKRELRHRMIMKALKESAEDDDASFGNYVKLVLKKLPPRMKLQAKNEIYGLLSKYEMKHLDMQEEGRISPPISSNASSTTSVSCPQEFDIDIKEEPLCNEDSNCDIVSD